MSALKVAGRFTRNWNLDLVINICEGSRFMQQIFYYVSNNSIWKKMIATMHRHLLLESKVGYMSKKNKSLTTTDVKKTKNWWTLVGKQFERQSWGTPFATCRLAAYVSGASRWAIGRPTCSFGQKWRLVEWGGWVRSSSSRHHGSAEILGNDADAFITKKKPGVYVKSMGGIRWFIYF